MVPDPEGPSASERAGCLVLLLPLAGLSALTLMSGHRGLAVFFGAPLLFAVGYWVYGRLLVFLFVMWRQPRGVRGVLVVSESPVWKQHIEAVWLARVGGSLTTLNWSERRSWPRSLDVRLWRWFCGRYRKNYCPSAVVLRGLGRPLVFRFHGAFQLAKHGDDSQLRGVEEAFFRSL